ncbi:MAG: 30S ribosomal protein S16 [Candidatus Dadabacteria bacterium]|nr:30S ribosomal protein S16 [Candidatus Dadabacteria bacterium]NIY22776.1 30S ribosomal protein S16 [Candidatus Dadabacteria bacterium]
MRMGSKKRPFYRIVAADSRAPRDGKFLEILGHYDPRTEPNKIEIKKDRIDAWVKNGAQYSGRVQKIISGL